MSEQSEYVELLCRRISSFLPNRTSHSIAQIELNPQFVDTKRILLSTIDKYPHLMSVLMECCMKNLKSINEESNNLKITQRDERSLTTTLMICKILAEILKEDWHRQKTQFNNNVTNFEIVLNYSCFHYYDLPKPLRPSIVHELIDTFIELLSANTVNHVFELVKLDSTTSTNISKKTIFTPISAPIPSKKQINHSNQSSNATLVNQAINHGVLNLAKKVSIKKETNLTSETDYLILPTGLNTSSVDTSGEKSSKFTSSGIHPNNVDKTSPKTTTKGLYSVVSPKTSKHSLNHQHSVSSVHTSAQSPTSHGTGTTTNANSNRKHQSVSPSSVPETSNVLPDDDKKIEGYLSDLDNCVELILRYIATANPAEFYEFIHQKLFVYTSRNESIPQQTLQEYCPLIKFMFFSTANSTRSAVDNLRAISYIQNVSWKLTFVTFITINIRNQSFARPGDYALIVSAENKELENLCRGLFDYVQQALEDKNLDSINTNCTSFVLTWLCLLCISDFIELENGKPNKLRVSFNKRIKFLLSIIHDTENLTSLESFSCLINIFHVGARLKSIKPDHPVYKFTLRYIDQAYNNLLNFPKDSRNYNEGEHEILIISFYLAALMLKPERYIKILIHKFIEFKDNIKEIKLLVKIIKGISESEKTTSIFSQVMKTLAVPLKSMIFGSEKILRKYDSNIQHPSASSSFASIYSDIYSIESLYQLSTSLAMQSKGFNETTKKLMKTSIDSYINDQDADNASSIGSVNSVSSSRSKMILDTEEMLSDLFNLFNAAPELYFNDAILMDDSNLETMPFEEIISSIVQYVIEVMSPLKQAFKSKTTNIDRKLFDSACLLAMTVAEKNNKLNQNYTTLSTFADFLISNFIVRSICEASLSWSITDSKFKAAFSFINDFLQKREEFLPRLSENQLMQDPRAAKIADLRGGVTQSIEKMLLLSLCTHDIQLYNIANTTMHWYIKILNNEGRGEQMGENLSKTFKRIIGEDTVFTGFVSLHKKFRSILRDAKPTKSLFQVWLIIYTRWLEMLDYKQILNEDNLVFRNFTGFLISTSGCFVSDSFMKADSELHKKATTYISDFFDKCIYLLSSKDLVIRVVIKETMSHELHPAVYHLIASKFITLSNFYLDKKESKEEVILFVEQAMIIVTAMIQIRNYGGFMTVTCFRDIGPILLKIIDLAENVNDILRLKLRFSKLSIAVESERESFGVAGAIKYRNFLAKKSAEWLEKALFNDIDSDEHDNSRALAFLNADMAYQCSKALSMQLDENILEIPDGIKDSEVKKYKDLAFGNYFSIFYKIIQKYCIDDNSDGSKSKYKINLIADNTLNCISNILQSDTDIGMQFVLPLGYHSNSKIRALFLNVFSTMLNSRKTKSIEEFLDKSIKLLTDLYPIYGAVAEEASSTEHNLLASALYGVFKYTLSLNKLFKVLLDNEIDHVMRSTDIFRRNSTLTRLLSNFARENGKDYLIATIRPFIQELIDNSIHFEIEKLDKPDSSPNRDSELFIFYFKKLVEIIIESFDVLPLSLRFICSQIYASVNAKFEEASLVAVGSFLFLRFICPAIVSPETFVDLTVTDPKIRRSLMQLVKVLQNVANDSLGLVKWQALISYNDQLIDAKKKIYPFLERVASEEILEYTFPKPDVKPIAELRYLHKFVYTYLNDIRARYMLGDPLSPYPDLQMRINLWRELDQIMKSLGIPKSNVPLQINASYKSADPNNTANSKFNDFMTKMSLTYIDQSDNIIIRNSIFLDGTPVVVLNFRHLDTMIHDVQFMVYKLFEIAVQVWDNTFYMVYDFTESLIANDINRYFELLREYAPMEVFKNCVRVYFFNIPIETAQIVANATISFQKERQQFGTKVYVYSLVDRKEIINNLNLDSLTLSAIRDTRVVFHNAKLYLSKSKKYLPVSIRLGSQYVQICSEIKYDYRNPMCGTVDYIPVEVYKLVDITKCEVSSITEHQDEFTIVLNYDRQLTLRSNDRSEILRFLYFSTSRLAKTTESDAFLKELDNGEHNQPWFGRLYNIVFQGLLCNDEEVKSSASALFASLSTFFDIDFGIKISHAKNISFPTNISDFVVSVSSHLAKTYPKMTNRFFKAFYENYEKIPEENRVCSVMYLTPWIDNIYEHVYVVNEENGEDRVNQIVRQFSRLTMMNKAHIPFLNDYFWKRLFKQTTLLPILVDEVVAFAIDNNTTENSDWAFITAVICPSVDVCGEVVKKLISCVNNAKKNDSAIASRSKLFEIRVLVKICASLFFNSYTITRLYLADIFLLVTLFIDNVYLDFGADLQKLMLNLIQSFLHKPNLTDVEQEKVDEAIEYFSSQRAKMLFGVTREINSTNLNTNADTGQTFNRILNFEILCDYLNDFINVLGCTEDKHNWRSHWVMNAMNVAFARDSIFQTRALLVVGILSKRGVVDSIASKFLKIIATAELNTLEVTTSAAISTACLIEGLPYSSNIPCTMMWPQFCFGLLNYSAVYQSSTTILVNSLVKVLNSGSNYLEKAFERRKFLEPYLSQFEESQNFSITKENFDFYVFFVLTQGLKIAHFKHTSIKGLKRYFEAQYKSGFVDFAKSTHKVEILAFIYLSMTDKEFFEYLEKINLEIEAIHISPKLLVPTIVVDFFLADSISSKTALIQCASLYSSTTVDSNFKARFLPLYNYILTRNQEMGLLVYHSMKLALDIEFINSGSVETASVISEIKDIVLQHDDYSIEKYDMIVDEFLTKNKIDILKRSHHAAVRTDLVSGEVFQASVGDNIKKIQAMMYRASFIHVEGEFLEE